MHRAGISHQPPSPLRTMGILLGALFSLEIMLMFALPYLVPTHNEVLANLADAASLTVLFLPLLYFYIFRPYRRSAELQKSLSENVLLHVIDGVVIFTADGMIDSFNRAAENLFGYAASEVAGRPISSLAATECRHKMEEALLHGDGSTGAAWECTGVRKDGSTIELELSVSDLRLGKEPMRLAIIRDITLRRKGEEELRRALSLLSTTLESTAEGILVRDLVGKTVIYNRRFAEMWRIPESVLSTHDDEVMREHVLDQLKDPRAFMELTTRLYREPERESQDILHFKDHRVFERVSLPHVVGGRIAGRVICFRDVTEQTQLEQQLRHAQKMEALGTLAGGVAHDFNNILTVIIGYSNVIARSLKKDDPLQHPVDQIIAASDRAASLTASLLAYSRKTTIDPKPIELNQELRNFNRFLKRLIGEKIELVTRYADHPLTVLADRGQIEQVLMNLAANARDAMSGNGCLVIDLHPLTIDADFVKLHGFGPPGDYAVITVADTGAGMDEATREKIFEPFFTTKETGHGTGLGLSIVYGIVRQHRGHINVYSEAGKGTTMNIYLPLTADAAQPPLVVPEPMTAGHETVLLIEDDQSVRGLVGNVLQDAGYRVIEAVDGEEAVAKFREAPETDLLLLDVIMPKKNGKETYEEIRALRPGVKAIFMSGYTADIVQKNGLIGDGLVIMNKPLAPNELLYKIREVLDRPRG
ncbi:hybrid sensor histidine kinase/response regulator [Geomesophilobacter sediminis]|uniref:histidine kinase n=1 Tax=Geomesophilobacter sediminis TaxID=2798584 RepID=A0A8J7SBS5_9BACT|nr:ATP-binding protein [Geomesophilobacter sediminis]MBJ6727926.1 PAS domain S-box protein [Geomesophilobacter sediminis]